MRKRIYSIGLRILVLFWWICNFVNWEMSLWNTSSIINWDINKVIDTKINWHDIDHPIQDWIYWVVKWWWDDTGILWLVWTDNEIQDNDQAFASILKLVQNIVNYTLWIVSLVALIYIIIHWIIMLTAAGDDWKFKKWLKWIKNAAVALAWIWFSRIIISFILRLINTFTQ